MPSVQQLKNELDRLSDVDATWEQYVSFRPARPEINLWVTGEDGERDELVISNPGAPPHVRDKQTGHELPLSEWDGMTPSEKRQWLAKNKQKSARRRNQ